MQLFIRKCLDLYDHIKNFNKEMNDIIKIIIVELLRGPIKARDNKALIKP